MKKKHIYEPHFNGPVYNPIVDFSRLCNQHERIKNCMIDQRWRTLNEISELTGDPCASISAQLRHLRKKRFGSWIVDKRLRGKQDSGLYEYRLLPKNFQSNFFE